MRARLTVAVLVLVAVGFAPTGSAEEGGDCSIPAELRAGRPDPAAGPTRVEVGVFVIDVFAVNDVSQSFTADVHLSVRWRDSRLASDRLGRSLAGCRLSPNELWNPNIAFVNKRNLTPSWDDLVAVDGDGLAHYRQRFVGEFSFRADLHDFPFDSQRLPLPLTVMTYPSDQVELAVDKQRSGVFGEFAIPGWEVVVEEPKTGSWTLTGSVGQRSRADFGLVVHRELGHTLWKVLVPLVLIVFMAWTVFWIDPTLLPPQVGIATSSVLTLIAFNLSLGYLLPRISYLTRADRFTLGCSVLVFLALGETVLTSRLAKTERYDAALRVDRWSRWLYLAALALIAAWSLWL